MAAKAQLTTLLYATTSVGKIQSFSGPSISHPVIDVSSLSDSSRQKIAAGIVDSGQLTFDILFEGDLAIHNHLMDEVIAGNSGACVLTLQGLTATSSYSFTAFPTEITPSGSVGEAVQASVTFDITGVVTPGV